MAHASIKKDRTDDTGFPWQYNVDTDAGDAIDYGSVASQPEAMAQVEHALTHRDQYDNTEAP